MRPTRLVRLFILLVLTATAGGARASEVAIPFTLATGDSHRLAVTLTQERYQGSERPMAITASAFVDVAVLGKRGTDLIVAWTYRDLQVEGGGPQAKLFRDLFGVLEGQRIEYYLDQDGAVVGLHNLDDVLALNREFVDEFTASLSEQLGNAQLAAMIEKMVAPLLTPEAVELTSLEGPQLFHFFAGASLEPDVLYGYEDILALPGGGTVPARAEFSLRGHDVDGRTGVIDWRQYPDPDRAAAALQQMIAVMAAQAGVTLPEDFDLSGIVIEDSAEFEMDLTTGLARRIRHQRETTILEQGRVKRTVVRLIE